MIIERDARCDELNLAKESNARARAESPRNLSLSSEWGMDESCTEVF